MGDGQKENAVKDKDQQAFLADVRDHQMTVLRDDGLYRHLRFSRPGTICQSFELLTYPRGLLYRGDMGAFVFERLEDMFEFFRTDGGRINPGYWSSKLAAVDQDGVTQFDGEQFDREIKREVLTWCRDNAHRTTKDERRDLWDAVLDDVIGASPSGDEGAKKNAAGEFSHCIRSHNIRRSIHFSFDSPWEMGSDSYTPRFLWCCHALVWGIAKYDEMKAQEKAVAPVSEGCAA
jgi:hypothetical protein